MNEQTKEIFTQCEYIKDVLQLQKEESDLFERLKGLPISERNKEVVIRESLDKLTDSEVYGLIFAQYKKDNGNLTSLQPISNIGKIKVYEEGKETNESILYGKLVQYRTLMGMFTYMEVVSKDICEELGIEKDCEGLLKDAKAWIYEGILPVELSKYLE